MNLFDGQGRPIRLDQEIGRGGEAVVYRIGNGSGEIVKVYEPAPRPDYPAKLTWMVSHPPVNPTQALIHPSLAWPDGLLYNAQARLVGFSMPFIRSAVPILDVFNPHRRRIVLPRFDRRYLHRAARNLAAAVGTLHRHGYVAGDLNESNVLVTPSALVTLIDTDSFQVEEARDGQTVMHYCPVGKPEYLPPELQGRPLAQTPRTSAQDNFALAVLVFQLLMEGNHPFRAQWLGGGEPPPLETRIAQGAFPYTCAPRGPVKPPQRAPGLDRLHPALAELMRRCFIDGYQDPHLRPTPSAWEATLTEAEQALVMCPRGHVYSNHFSACPDCPPPPRRPFVAPPPPKAAPAQPKPVPDPRPKPQPATAARPVQAASWSAAAPRAAAASAQPRPAPRSAPPPPVRPAKRPAASVSRPAQRAWPPIRLQRKSVLQWVGPRVAKSLVIGGALGALGGAIPGAALAAASGSLGNVVAWTLLIALGGACGGLLRGWKPGYRLGAWIDQHLRWSVFWQGAGMVLGGALGLMLGLMFWWAVFPIFLGLVMGARIGASGGRWAWQAATRFGWGRIWAVVGGVGAAGVGWLLASWAATLGLGQLVSSWIVPDATAGLVGTWILTGALCGGLGGAMAGVTADLFARLTGLVD